MFEGRNYRAITFYDLTHSSRLEELYSPKCFRLIFELKVCQIILISNFNDQILFSFFRLPKTEHISFNVKNINYLQSSFWKSMTPHHPHKLVLNLKSIWKCNSNIGAWRPFLKSSTLTMATYLKKLRPFKAMMTMRCHWIFVISIFMVKFKATHMESMDTPDVECPASSESSACPCYKFDDGKSFHF